MSKNTEERILSLRLERKKYPAELVERYIMYRGNKIVLDSNLYDEILSTIPEMWNSDKDRLTQFVWFADGTFLCVRSKDIYNFSIKESEEKIYFFDSVTKEQLDSFVKLLIEFYNKINLDAVQKFYDSVYDSLSDLSYIKQRIIDMRDEALRESDYMFNSDYTFKNAADEEEWRKYRQDWRDITEKDFWKNNDFTNISLPVAPVPKNTYNLMIQSLSSSLGDLDLGQNLVNQMQLNYDNYVSIASNYGNIMFKLEILKTLNKLKVPISLYKNTTIDSLDGELNAIESNLLATSFLPLDLEGKYRSASEIKSEFEEVYGSNIDNVIDKQIKSVEEKLSLIDERLKEFNIDVKISDIIEKYVEDMKLKALEIEKNQQVQDLIFNIQMGDTP